MYFKHIPVSQGITGFCSNQPTRCEQKQEFDTLALRDREKTRALWLHVLSQKLCIDFKGFAETTAGFHGNYVYGI